MRSKVHLGPEHRLLAFLTLEVQSSVSLSGAHAGGGGVQGEAIPLLDARAGCADAQGGDGCP